MGLVTIYHPWESGTDNSPTVGRRPRAGGGGRDAGLRAPGPPARGRSFGEAHGLRVQTVHLARGDHETRAMCDEDAIYETQQFQVKDVLASAILIAANEALLEIAEVLEVRRRGSGVYPVLDLPRPREGLEKLLAPRRPRNSTSTTTCSPMSCYRPAPWPAFSPPSWPVPPGARTTQSPGTPRLQSAEFLGHPDLYRSLPPSTSPEDPGFKRRSYWRGPFWPIITWLVWWSLGRSGEVELAARLRRTALAQISEHGFGEYFDPFTGESLGARRPVLDRRRHPRMAVR